MSSRVLTVLILVTVTLPAICQPPQPVAQKQQLTKLTQVPEYMVWDAFFRRVDWLNRLADRLDGASQKGAWARNQISQQAHLTSQQQQSLNTIVTDYQASNGVILSQLTAMAASAGSGSNSQRVQELQSQRKQNVLDHVVQVQGIFATMAGFQSFSGYVHGTTKVQAYVEPMASPATQGGREPL